MATAYGEVTTEIIDGINGVTVLTDRVKERREECLAAPPHLCAERSHLFTESWKESEGEPIHMRRAKAFKKFLEGNSVVIREGELIVGSQTKYIRGASPSIDFDPEYAFELFKDKSITLSNLVKVAQVTEEEKATLLQDASYWRGKSPREAMSQARREVFGDKIDDMEEAGVCIGNLTRPTSATLPDHGKVIKMGLKGIIAEAKQELQKLSFDEGAGDDVNKYYFLQAAIIACEGVINYAHRYAELAKHLASKEGDPIRKKELERIANICQWVPANPARNFHEALQCFWFIHLCGQLEHAFSNETPGRMDQYLYPLYKKDIEGGRLTRQEAAELLGCLWVKFAEIEHVRGKVWKSASQANQVQDVTIGGITSDDKDATNELTYLLLEVAGKVKTVQPPLYLRCHKDTPERLWTKAIEVNRDRGDGVPAFLNDQAVLLNFVAKGIPIEEARDWSASACVKPDASHASSAGVSITISLAKILELTLHNGVDPRTGKQIGLVTGDPKNFSSFAELYDAFKKQTDYFFGILARSHRLTWHVRGKYYSLPFFSAVTDDCIKKGKEYTEGGIRYPQLYFGIRDRGHQDVADSLAAIKQVVFDEKKVSMDRLLKALKANFEGNGNEEVQRMLLAAPKYGNDLNYVDDLFDDLSQWTQRRIFAEKNPMGFGTTDNRSGASIHYYFGKTVGALPNGRKAWKPLADGSLSPVQGVDSRGPTAVINSASKINHTETSRGTLFNMKFPRNILQNRETLQKLIAMVKTYFDRGGFHLQFNLQGTEILKEAKKQPAQFRDLLVRVAGYSAHFVDLSSEVQDEIIARTEHQF